MFTPESKTYFVLDYNELDEIAHKYFPKFEFVADAEMNNGSDKSFNNVTKAAWEKELQSEYFKKWGIKDFNDMLNGNGRQHNVWEVLEYLVYMDELPEGNYLIEVSW